jgi:hypothetical protein
MVIDFPEADETPSQCISLSLNPEFIENSLNHLNYHLPKVDETSRWNIELDEYFYLIISLWLQLPIIS